MANITDNIIDYGNKYANIGPGIIPNEHMANWGDALISKNPPWSTTPEYHQWGAKDLTQQMSKKIADVPYVGNLGAAVFELAAPFIAGGASIPYEIASGISKYGMTQEYPDQNLYPDYTKNNKWDKINAYFPDLEGTSVSGILNAIDMEDPLSAAWNRFLGAGQPLYNRLMHKPQNLYDVENRKNLRILNMNRRKQIMQQNIKQGEAAEAAKKKSTTYISPARPHGEASEQITTPPKRYVSPARPHSADPPSGGGGGGPPGGQASWKGNIGGLVDFYRHGGFSG